MKDFEKKYNDALEKAKAGKPIEEIFPEIKMTDDERMKDWIVEFLMDSADKLLKKDGGGYYPSEVRKFQNAIDWLKSLEFADKEN